MIDLNTFDDKLLRIEISFIKSSIVTGVDNFGFVYLALFYNIQNFYIYLKKSPSGNYNYGFITHRCVFNFQLKCLLKLLRKVWNWLLLKIEYFGVVNLVNFDTT